MNAAEAQVGEKREREEAEEVPEEANVGEEDAVEEVAARKESSLPEERQKVRNAFSLSCLSVAAGLKVYNPDQKP